MAFKMKGNPMQRNFGVGASSPAQKSAYPAKGDPKRKNYSKNVIDASSAHATKDIDAPEYVKGFKQDSQRTMTQDRSKLSKYDQRMDKLQVEGFETDKGEQVMPKIMAPESIKSKPIPEKTLKSPMKDTGHGLGNHGKHGTKAEYDNAVARWNKGDPRSQLPNDKKLAKKTEKAEKKKLDYETKQDAHTKLVTDHFNSGKEFKDLPGKERRAIRKSGNKTVRAHKKSNVAESVRKYQASKVGNYMEKPEKKKTGGKLVSRGRNKTKDGVAVPNKTRKIFGNTQLKKDQGSGRKKESKEDKTTRKKDLKSYRQWKGLRGAINARRTGKGKDKI